MKLLKNTLTTIKLPYLSLVLLLIATSANRSFGQQKDFSGTWLFKSQESVTGTLYVNGSPKQVGIKQSDKKIYLEFVTSDGQAYTTTTETFDSGNTFVTKTAMGRKKVVTLTWSDDGTGFSETAIFYSLTDAAKTDAKNTDVWSMENGELILDRKNENFTNGEVWETRTIYAQQ